MQRMQAIHTKTAITVTFLYSQLRLGVVEDGRWIAPRMRPAAGDFPGCRFGGSPAFRDDLNRDTDSWCIGATSDAVISCTGLWISTRRGKRFVSRWMVSFGLSWASTFNEYRPGGGGVMDFFVPFFLSTLRHSLVWSSLNSKLGLLSRVTVTFPLPLNCSSSSMNA